MSVLYLQGFYQSLCSYFDKEVREKHKEDIRVMFGACPDHFLERLEQRITTRETREEVLAAAFKYILIKYTFFSKLHENWEFSIAYHGWKICYKCWIINPDSQPRYIEVVPVTVFRHVKK